MFVICNYCLTVLHIASFNLEPNCFAGWKDQVKGCEKLLQWVEPCETIFGTVRKLVMEILTC